MIRLHTLLVLFYSLAFNVAAGQPALQGRVVDHFKKPVAGASVYFNNTSIGTMTDSSGRFSFTRPIYGELVVSSIGFERVTLDVKPEAYQNKIMVFELSPRQVTMQTVLVLSDAQRKKYLDIFKENFLGYTTNATLCSIENMGDIEFFASERDSFSFEASSEVPLILINHALGYIIKFDLVHFYFNTKTGATSYFGYANFEELRINQDFSEKRKEDYAGSSLHFFRSLIADRVKQEKFLMMNLVVDSSQKKTIKGRETFGRRYTPISREQLLSVDSVSGNFLVNWNETWEIGHPSKAALNFNSRFISAGPVGHASGRTYSHLTKTDAMIMIDPNGVILNPMDLYFAGEWARRKVANMLPFDYQPSDD